MDARINAQTNARTNTRIDVFSEEQTRAAAARLADISEPGWVVLVSGELGAGKTVFAKGFAAGLGVSELVTSPTFTIVNEYHSGRLPLFHFDLYRLESEADMEDTGWEDYFAAGGVSVVEWAERAPGVMPADAVRVDIYKDMKKGALYREIVVKNVPKAGAL